MGTPAQRLESERAKYPAMQVDEILVWRNWLQVHQAEYDRFDYNVRIGTGTDPGPAFPRNIRDMAIAIRSLRLDAVGYQGAAPTIFEVKRRAGPQNIGQLLTYKHLWTAAFPSSPAPALVLVGALMTESISQVEWKESTEAFPAFVTLVATPLTFSIATGLSLGVISYTAAKLAAGKWREVSVLLWILTGLFVVRYVVLAAE